MCYVWVAVFGSWEKQRQSQLERKRLCRRKSRLAPRVAKCRLLRIGDPLCWRRNPVMSICSTPFWAKQDISTSRLKEAQSLLPARAFSESSGWLPGCKLESLEHWLWCNFVLKAAFLYGAVLGILVWKLLSFSCHRGTSWTCFTRKAAWNLLFFSHLTKEYLTRNIN